MANIEGQPYFCPGCPGNTGTDEYPPYTKAVGDRELWVSLRGIPNRPGMRTVISSFLENTEEVAILFKAPAVKRTLYVKAAQMPGVQASAEPGHHITPP